MFERNVSTTPFYNDDANMVFTNITGDNFRGDVTFVSALRALLGKRIGDDTLTFKILNKTARADSDKELLMRECYLREEDAENNAIYLVNILASPEDLEKIFKVIYDEIVPLKTEAGWDYDPALRDFFGTIDGVACFTNKERKSTLIVVGNIGIKQSHWLACAIPRYIPWYFPNLPAELTEVEMNMCNALTPLNKEKRGTNFINALKTMAQEYDFRTKKLQTMLKGFESRLYRERLERVRRDKRSINNTLDDLMNQYSAKLQNLHDKEIVEAGLLTKMAEGEESCELLEYFIHNKNISLISANNSGNIQFETRGYLSYFDEDAAQTYIKRPTSTVYRPSGYNYSDEIPDEDMKKLMTAIFIDQTLRVKLCASFSIDNTSAVAMNKNDYRHYSDECEDYMPNPHIWHHRCINTHRDHMEKALRDHDYIGAIEQALASTMTLNVHDETVFAEFMRALYGHDDNLNQACIELPDGKMVKTKEAIEWLKAQEG